MSDYFGGQITYTYDALGRLVSIVNPYGEMTTFQYDANSRLIMKNLPNGTLITYATYTYDTVDNIFQSSGSVPNLYLYVGELGYYGDSGMYLLTQRWYSSVVGRFVVRDLYFYGDQCLYTYSANCPTVFVDPNGMFYGPWVCLGCAASLGSSF
ncbi:hypothetical protein H5T87_07545 [bacterium]|nr:hypothetical protein [bacterium]